MTTPAAETFALPWVQPFGPALRQHLLSDAGGIKPDDWIPDLGTLRQVDYVETISDNCGSVHIVHFKPQNGVPNLVRGYSAHAVPTVWRDVASVECSP